MHRASVSLAVLLVMGVLCGGVMVSLAAPPDPETAQPHMDAWMSTAENGQPAMRFPVGTTSVYAVVQYTDFATTTAQVIVRDSLGVTLLENIFTTSGSGMRSFRLSGDAAYDAYFSQVTMHGTTMKQKLSQASQFARPGAPISETQQITTTVELSMSEARQMQSALQGVRRFQLSDSAYQHIDAALASLSGLLDNGDEARKAGKSIDQIRTLIAQMVQQGDTAISEAGQAREGATYKTFLPLILRKQRPRALSVDVVASTSSASARPLPPSPGCDKNLQPLAFNTNIYMSSGQGQLLPVATYEWMVGNPGSAKYVDLDLDPGEIYAQSVNVPSASHTSVVTATVRDAQCLPVNDGIQVQFATNNAQFASVSPAQATTFTDPQGRGAGFAVTHLTAGADLGPGFVTVTATVGSAVAAADVALIGGPESVQLSTEYRYLRENSPSVVGGATNLVALVRDKYGRNVADDTIVTFSVNPSSLLYLPSNQVTVPTVDGAARARLSAKDQRGTASARATAGSASDAVSISVVGPAATLTVTAVPTTVVLGGVASYSDIRLEAVDDAGSPAPDGALFNLEVLDPTLAFFEIGGLPTTIVSLRDGRATARLLPTGVAGTTEVAAKSSENEDVQGITSVTFTSAR